jgi:Na+-translocating ferredoxin:NAD+ oxidoreductase RNF subunit RnfB
MPCKVTIIDAISGEEFKSEQDPLIESIKRILRQETELTEKCWKGYTQKGMKTMFGKRYPNCVKKTK